MKEISSVTETPLSDPKNPKSQAQNPRIPAHRTTRPENHLKAYLLHLSCS